jgi:hypothetical protein
MEIINSDKPIIGDSFYRELTQVCRRQLYNSTKFKEPRMKRIKLYEDLYMGNIPKKLRVQFNVAMPIMAGMIDTLAADFDEPITLKFTENDASDYFKVKKIKAAFEIEKHSTRPGAKWDLKTRWDKRNALFSGRGIASFYAESDPEYTSHFNIINFRDFHFQPMGGGHLESHFFCGEEGFLKSETALKQGAKDGIYDKTQVELITAKIGNADFLRQSNATENDKYARFKALGMDAESNNYIGEHIFNLVQWCVTYKGDRWYVLFEPFTGEWVRIEKLTDVYSSGYYPYVTWATHEDDKLFMTKSYADDIYPIADSVVTLFNQELTNREKRNMGARGYDISMVTDVGALDRSAYIPDALVPIDTQNGVKRIADAVYQFQTPELQGTINLLDYVEKAAGRQIGTDAGFSQPPSGKASVSFANQQHLAKRLSYRSQSYTEAYSELGIRYIQGLKDHLSQPMAIKILGENGWEWDEIKKIDLNTKRDIDITVTSSTAQQGESKIKKDARIQANNIIIANPLLLQKVNPKVVIENIYRDVGEYEDHQISELLDTDNFGSREVTAHVSKAIQELLLGKTPDLYYGADTVFMQKILDYATNHRNTLKEKFDIFSKYVQDHATIAAENMARKAGKINTMGKMPQEGQPTPEQTPTPQGMPTMPTPAPAQNTGISQAISNIQ